MDKQFEERLKGLEEQLRRFVDVMEESLGRDLTWPINAVRDGYYEAALTNAGSIIEAMLRDIWQREGIKGEGKKKTIEQLFSVVKEQAQMDRLVQDYVRDIQLVRNRAAHGEEIVIEDSLEALRKLTVILDWYFQRYVGETLEAGEARSAVAETAAAIIKPPRNLGFARVFRQVVTAVVAVVLFVTGWIQWNRTPSADTGSPASDLFVVAVAPFYGPDQESAREGRVMAALVDKEIREVLAADDAEVLGIEETQETVRDHDAARELGRRLGATVVVWGEAFALHGETEIEPSFTMVSPKPKKIQRQTSRGFAVFGQRPAGMATAPPVEDRRAATVNLSSRAPNQIELRRTSAAEIGDVVRLLVAAHALGREERPDKALRLLDVLSPTPEVLRLKAQSLLLIDRSAEAMDALQQAIAAEPDDVASHALLGDLYIDNGEWMEASASYSRIANTAERFNTTRGTVFRGRLLIGESYSSQRLSRGRTFQTIYLLEMNPETGRVLARHALPGPAMAFATSPQDVDIRYAALLPWGELGSSSLDTASIRWTVDGFDRPVVPSPNLMIRLRSTQGGLRLAANFLADPSSPLSDGFGLIRDPAPDAPADLLRLETGLRDAIDRDPTQPWHLFFLGHTLSSLGRHTEAEDAWENLLTGDFAAIPYYEYAWMATQYELWGHHRWADRAYDEALRRRLLLAQPVLGYSEGVYTTDMWRLMSPRDATPESVARALVWRQRIQALYGVELSGVGEVAEALWFRRLRATDMTEAAAVERRLLAPLRENPFGWLRYHARMDIWSNLLITAMVAFVIILGEGVLRASKRVWAEGDPPPATRWSQSWAWIGSLRFAEKAVALALILCTLLAFRAVPAGLGLCVMFCLIAVFLRRRGQRLSSIIGAMRLQEVVAVSLAALVVVGSLAGFAWAREHHSWAPFTLNITDGLSTEGGLAYFEHRLEKTDLPPTRYVTAVLAQIAGLPGRAKELYAPLSADPRVRSNIEAIASGNPPTADALTLHDLERADLARPWRANLGQLRLEAKVFAMVWLAALALIAAIPGIIRKKTKKASSRTSRAACLLMPGLHDLRRGLPLRGSVTFLLTAFASITTIIGLFTWPMPGLTTSLSAPRGVFVFWWADALIRPEIVESIGLSYSWNLFMVFPYAKELWAAAIVCAVIGLALHAGRVPEILRLGRSSSKAREPVGGND